MYTPCMHVYPLHTCIPPGSSYKDYMHISEPYNRLQSAVSTLSKGPVAPSDKIGRSDAMHMHLYTCTRPSERIRTYAHAPMHMYQV